MGSYSLKKKRKKIKIKINFNQKTLTTHPFYRWLPSRWIWVWDLSAWWRPGGPGAVAFYFSWALSASPPFLLRSWEEKFETLYKKYLKTIWCSLAWSVGFINLPALVLLIERRPILSIGNQIWSMRNRLFLFVWWRRIFLQRFKINYNNYSLSFSKMCTCKVYTDIEIVLLGS